MDDVIRRALGGDFAETQWGARANLIAREDLVESLVKVIADDSLAYIKKLGYIADEKNYTLF